MILPLYNSLAPLTLNRVFAAAPAYDPDAQAYIDAVELEDGQALEVGVKDAINDFVVGCKSDGIWSAIKAACILAGARTLDGALVPLVGTAPTNNNFVSGDYDRETGLVGNGLTKYLDSNRANSDDAQNNAHLSVNVSEQATANAYYAGSGINQTGSLIIFVNTNGVGSRMRNSTVDYFTGTALSYEGFAGVSRNNSSNYQIKAGASTQTKTRTSNTPLSTTHHIFKTNGSSTLLHAGRLSFYSIGESLDLALLDTRVSTLITDLAAAI